MNLESFFQLSVSIFAIIATIFILTLFYWAIVLRIQLKKLIIKLEEISEIAKTTAGKTKDFVQRTIETLEKFRDSILTFEFVRKITTEIISSIKGKPKGE